MIGLSKIKELSIDKSFIEENDNESNENKELGFSFENDNEINKIDIENYRMLQKVGNVFDSLDDEDTSFSNFYIDPNNYILRFLIKINTSNNKSDLAIKLVPIELI